MRDIGGSSCGVTLVMSANGAHCPYSPRGARRVGLGRSINPGIDSLIRLLADSSTSLTEFTSFPKRAPLAPESSLYL